MATWLNETSFSGYNGSHFRLKLYYDISQSTEGNYSDVTFYLYFTSQDGYSGSGSSANGHINNTYVGNTFSVGRNASVYLGSKTERYNHNEDGTCNANYSATIYCNWTGLGDTTLNGTLSLPTIQRKAIVTSATNFTDEENPTITFNNPAGYRINAKVEFAGEILVRQNIPNTGSYTFELTSAERTLLRQKCTGKTMTVRQTIATCIGGTTENGWSWQDKQMSMVNATPIETSIETIDTNSTTTDLTGNNHTLVKYKSNARVVAIFNTLKYATLSSLTINGVDVTSSAVAGTQTDGVTPYTLTYTINSFDGNSVKVVATDTRGYALEIEDTPLIVDYFLISANASFYRVQPTTGQIGVKFNGNYFNDTFGDENNTLIIRYKYKKTTDQNYSNYVSLVENTDYKISNNTFYSGTSTSESQIVLSTLFDYRYEYELVFEFIDELSTSTTTAIIQKGIPIIWWNKTKFQVNGDLYVADNDGNNARKITDLDIYSSSEIVVGKWINNKPLYRKVIDIGNLPVSGTKTVYTGLDFQNTCVCRKLYGMVVNPQNGVSLPLPFISLTLEYCISIVIDTYSNILITVGADRSGVSGYAIIEYTKNTD